LKQEGIIAFVSAKDVPGMNSCSLVPGEEPVFAEVGKDVIYVGQIVGMVVARTHRQAKSASRMVKCTFSDSETAPTFTLEDAEAKKSFLYGPDFPGKALNVGDVDAAFADPENIIIEGDHNFGGQNNFYMEKQTCIAMPDDMGRIQIYGGCQCPDNTKTHVMIAMGCSSHDIVIQNRPMGGAFGGKFTRQFSTFCASAIAAKTLGRPVRIAMDLHQDMGASGNTRHICRTHYKIATTKAGKIVGVDNRMLIDAGCANDFTDFIADEILKKQDYAYDLPNYRGILNMTKTNMPNASAVRAPGLAQSLAITETMIDAVAHTLNMTQEQVREINMKQLKSESYVPRDQTGQEITEWNMPTLWAECKAAFEFEARERAIAEFNVANRYKKRGIAMQPLKYTVGYLLMSGAQATVNINSADGTVAIQTGCCEMGQGCLTKVISTAASVLGIPYEKVSAFYPNSSVLPNLQTDGGSAGTEVLCHATADACRILKERLKPVEEVLLEEKKASAEASGESGEDVSATWEEICARAFGPMPTDTRVSLSATAMHSDPKYNAIRRTADHPPAALPFWNLDPIPGDMWQYYTTGCAATEVEVDVLTGAYTVLRADVVLDAGNSLNPLIDLGQAEGGYVYGLGCYLQEEVLMDAASGRNKSDGTWNYKPPGNKDVPQVFNVSLHPGNRSSRTMFGSKGIGEAPFLLGYSAVSAIRVAVRASRLERGLSGEFQLDSPATVDRVQQAVGLCPADMSLE
jgi:xanthine dehydrogenase molybdopterin-binding subunit B